MKRVIIRKNDYGYEWKGENTKWYSIQLEQIFPDRRRAEILSLCKNGGFITFNYFEYYRNNRMLMISNDRML